MIYKTFIKLSLGVAVLGATQVFATYARVESMGKHATYIMDDISIFDNPANINIFPNYLIGEMGAFQDDLSAGSNRDPQHPWFGGIFSLALGQEDSRDPRFSIGGAFNRVDEKTFRFLPDSVVFRDNMNVTRRVAVPDPVTNFDGFLGFTTTRGDMFGAHIYVAMQDGGERMPSGDFRVNRDAFASIVKGSLGTNFQVNENIDMEVSGGFSRIQFGPERRKLFDSELYSGFTMARAFSTIEAINGELVPAFSYSYTQTPGVQESRLVVGSGVNVSLDRGFFWLGVDYIMTDKNAHNWDFLEDGTTLYHSYINRADRDIKTENGGRISFGIERGIWWEWLVIRVGGQKVITYVECDSNINYQTANPLCRADGNYMYSNPIGNGSMNDHVGFGIGINVEEKLKVDATIAEDVLYRNPFQGAGRLFSRVSATYSF